MWGNYWGNTPPQRYWTVSYWPMGGATGAPAPIGGGSSRFMLLVGVGASWFLAAVLSWQTLRLLARQLTA